MTVLQVRWLSSEPTTTIRNTSAAVQQRSIRRRDSHECFSTRRLRTVARSSLQDSSGDAWRESGWADEEEGTPQQSFPDVSLLTSGEIVRSIYYLIKAIPSLVYFDLGS